jgi:hypothetical protein
MSVDPETVISMATYRVGFLAPRPDSLTAGELYIELGTTAGTAPRLWVGVAKDEATPGNIVSLVPVGAELPPPLPDTAPVNVDVPHVTPDVVTVADTLNCTMGNWENEPTEYHYQWMRDGSEPIGTDSADYVVVDLDVDHAIACVLTAENARGATTAPPSNAVTPIAGAARETETEAPNHDRHKRHR